MLCSYRALNGFEPTMLGQLRAFFMDRRIATRRTECDGCEERRIPTREEANSRLDKAIDSFSETITCSPERLKQLLKKAIDN